MKKNGYLILYDIMETVRTITYWSVNPRQSASRARVRKRRII